MEIKSYKESRHNLALQLGRVIANSKHPQNRACLKHAKQETWVLVAGEYQT
jgi:hypothetical protein